MRRLIFYAIGFAATLTGLLPAICRRELFRIAARSIGMKYAVFEGKQGKLEAPVYDRVIWPLYLSQGGLDTGTCDFLRRFFKSGSGTLIDVGANLGVVCIPAKQSVPGIDVYAVEPDPDNFECLRMNVFRAGFSDIVLFQRAAYRRECVLNFECSSENSGDHRIRSNQAGSGGELYNESSRPVVQVQASPLDSLIPFSGLKRPVIITCDVQGAETDALAGATQLLNLADVVIIEFWPYGLKRAGANLDELLSMISRFPYGSRFDAMDKTSIHLVPIRELTEQLRQFYYAKETGISHYDLVLSKEPLSLT
jgi:FkbM family methyltransferase